MVADRYEHFKRKLKVVNKNTIAVFKLLIPKIFVNKAIINFPWISMT